MSSHTSTHWRHVGKHSAFMQDLSHYAVKNLSQLFHAFAGSNFRIDMHIIRRKALWKLQGGFFNWSALKMTKCQTLWKIWHLELFWRDLHVIWHLVIFRADQLKKPPCIWIIHLHPPRAFFYPTFFLLQLNPTYRVVFFTVPPKKWLSVRLHVNPFKKVLSVRIS